VKYDPQLQVDPQAWMALDESERLDSVAEYHRLRKVRLPNIDIHATFHAIVENQVALGDGFPAKSVLSRLMAEGLDRHEAVHAIASVLSGRIFDALQGKDPSSDLNAEYLQQLDRLTAESWRKGAL